MRKHPERYELLHGVTTRESDPNVARRVLHHGLQSGSFAQPGLTHDEQAAAPARCCGREQARGIGNHTLALEEQGVIERQSGRPAGPRGIVNATHV